MNARVYASAQWVCEVKRRFLCLTSAMISLVIKFRFQLKLIMLVPLTEKLTILVTYRMPILTLPVLLLQSYFATYNALPMKRECTTSLIFLILPWVR